tara:strand:+ start:171 stop:773 length:603 start_codon:yes stop_codon:yes gene_type:complete
MDNETEIETKVCPQCGEEKALTFDNFYRSKQTKSGFKPWCKPCVNASNKAYDKANPEQHSRRVVVSRNRTEERKQRHRDSVNKHRNRNYLGYRDTNAARKYGVPKGWYKEQIEKQGGRCRICGVKMLTPEHKKYLSVDHNHKTGAVRGVICNGCNTGIGMFKENPVFMEAAIRYLKETANEDHRACKSTCGSQKPQGGTD